MTDVPPPDLDPEHPTASSGQKLQPDADAIRRHESPPSLVAAIGWVTVVGGVAAALGAVVMPTALRFMRALLEMVAQDPAIADSYTRLFDWLDAYEGNRWWFGIAQFLVGVSLVVVGRAFLRRRRWALPALAAAATALWLVGLAYVWGSGVLQPRFADTSVQYAMERINAFAMVANGVIATVLYAVLMIALARSPVRGAFREHASESTSR